MIVVEKWGLGRAADPGGAVHFRWVANACCVSLHQRACTRRKLTGIDGRAVLQFLRIF